MVVLPSPRSAEPDHALRGLPILFTEQLQRHTLLLEFPVNLGKVRCGKAPLRVALGIEPPRQRGIVQIQCEWRSGPTPWRVMRARA